MKYEEIVYIGRFQPFHLGHAEVVRKALELSETVIIVLGSYKSCCSLKNPWDVKERMFYITMSCAELGLDISRIRFKPVRDSYSESFWLKSIQEVTTCRDNNKIGIIGCSKDSSSYYLKCFPQWSSEETSLFEGINSTDIRKTLFSNEDITRISDRITPSMCRYLDDYRCTDAYARLTEEYKFAAQSSFGREVDVAVVVVCSGHVLVSIRNHYPGKGLYNLSSSFVGCKEKISDCSKRILRVEFGANCEAELVLSELCNNLTSTGRMSLIHVTVFTMDCLLQPRFSKWMSLREVGEEEHLFYEDHFQIISSMVSRI